MNFVALHHHPELLDECCELLNSEWPMSLAGRRSMLEKSRDDFPCSFVLVENIAGHRQHIIGHSRVGLVIDKPWAVWIKSVVVHKQRRRQGIGKLLMLKTEQFAKSKGYRFSYLTTHDQQGFYTSLGYENCSPVCFSCCSILGAPLIRSTNQHISKNNHGSASQCVTVSKTLRNVSLCINARPPPPPAPPPLMSATNSPTERIISSSEESLQKIWMKKNL